MKTPPGHPVALIPAAIILTAALPLASCSWHFGDRVREAHVLYTGADISRPVDGKVYAQRSNRDTLDGQPTYDYYVLAPEVTYYTSTPLALEGTNLLFGYKTGIRHKKDTGKSIWCEVLRGEAEEVSAGNYARLCKERVYGQMITGLPRGARTVCKAPPSRATWNRSGQSGRQAAGTHRPLLRPYPWTMWWIPPYPSPPRPSTSSGMAYGVLSTVCAPSKRGGRGITVHHAP